MALLSIRITPTAKGLTPYEMLYCKPYYIQQLATVPLPKEEIDLTCIIRMFS